MRADDGRGEDEEVFNGLSSRRLIPAMRGFSCIFWGMPISILLNVHAIEIAMLGRFCIPSYLVGMLMITIGMAFLYFARMESVFWGKTSRGGLLASCILISFGPFVYWFTYLPRVGFYYTGNLMLMVLSFHWLLWSINQLASEIGAMTGDLDLAIEARICAWSVVAFMLVPLVLILMFSGALVQRYESNLLSEIQGLRNQTPIWAQIFFFLPLSLTMVATWKAKERCLSELGRLS